MRILKNIFKTKDVPVQSYDDFWTWFREHEKIFHSVVKRYENIERDFFNKLSLKLDQLKDGFWFLTGMYDHDTVELIITADGNIKNFVFVEELIEAAPQIKGWKFTALKPASDIENVSIKMAEHEFNSKTLYFYANDHADYPDEVDINIVHNNFTDENQSIITKGIYIFLDNYLGELDFAINIDNLKIIDRKNAAKELIPIEKLKDYLTWRQKEFIEKYEGIRYHSDDDELSVLEAELENGNMLVAIINTDLLQWKDKTSYPWILTISIPFDGNQNKGMPDKETYQFLEEMENIITSQLKDSDGYLKIGRQTADSVREIYFACQDFRKPSKFLFLLQKEYARQFEISYEIYKDKYWISFNRFIPQ